MYKALSQRSLNFICTQLRDASLSMKQNAMRFDGAFAACLQSPIRSWPRQERACESLRAIYLSAGSNPTLGAFIQIVASFLLEHPLRAHSLLSAFGGRKSSTFHKVYTRLYGNDPGPCTWDRLRYAACRVFETNMSVDDLFVLLRRSNQLQPLCVSATSFSRSTANILVQDTNSMDVVVDLRGFRRVMEDRNAVHSACEDLASAVRLMLSISINDTTSVPLSESLRYAMRVDSMRQHWSRIRASRARLDMLSLEMSRIVLQRVVDRNDGGSSCTATTCSLVTWPSALHLKFNTLRTSRSMYVLRHHEVHSDACVSLKAVLFLRCLQRNAPCTRHAKKVRMPA